MKILVPVDGDPVCLLAVRHALWLVAQGLRADLLLANVQPPPSLYEIVVAHDPDVIKDVSTGAGAHVLEPARAMCRAAGVNFECEIVSGDPVRALCELAEQHGCAQIVIGSHAKGALAAVLGGSLSQALAHVASVPVTIVRAAERVPVSLRADAAPHLRTVAAKPH